MLLLIDSKVLFVNIQLFQSQLAAAKAQLFDHILKDRIVPLPAGGADTSHTVVRTFIKGIVLLQIFLQQGDLLVSRINDAEAGVHFLNGFADNGEMGAAQKQRADALPFKNGVDGFFDILAQQHQLTRVVIDHIGKGTGPLGNVAERLRVAGQNILIGTVFDGGGGGDEPNRSFLLAVDGGQAPGLHNAE